MAMCTRLVDPTGRSTASIALPNDQWTLEIRRGETHRLDRVVALHTSRDTDDPLGTARRHVQRAIHDVAGITARHRDAWLGRWKASDVRIEGEPAAQRTLRFAIYHLSSAANPEDDRVSIGARGLSGAAYQGHVFWDTDIFMLPFFTFTYPEAARALVMYRYHTLAGARAKAARLGYRGALYAWESADTGEEMTPPFVVAPDSEVIRILTGEQEQHISADVAFGVWKYWEATGDERLLIEAGAEILIETARFWASRAEREEDGRYHIRGVIGPDEYHESVDDNAYTNGMAQWNLEIGEQVSRLVAERWPQHWSALSRRLGLEREEPRRWLRVARELYSGFDERTGLFEQFQGYFGLEEIDLTAFASRTAPMDVLLGRERIQRSKIIKQADVVMLIYLLWERLPPDVRRANFEYYEPRCGHGSSLSPAIHSLVAARLGNIALAKRYFRQAAEIDLANNMGNAAGGIHAAAMGGLWQAAVFGFVGLRLTQEGPEHHPNLPPSWRSLSMQFLWRDQWHEITVPQRSGDVRKDGDAP
jgi:kojibiose phosphorylase